MSEGVRNNESFKELIRYRNNKMSDSERYEFERALERDPFLADALEGYSAFKTSDIENDLNAINLLSGKKNKRIRPVVYLSVAASLLVLVVSSILMFNDKESNPIVVESKSEPMNETELFPQAQEFVMAEDTVSEQMDTTILIAQAEKPPIPTQKREKVNTEIPVNEKPDTKKSVATQKVLDFQTAPKMAMQVVKKDDSTDNEVAISAFVDTKEDTPNAKKIDDFPILVPAESLKDGIAEEAVVESNEAVIRDGLTGKAQPLGGQNLYKQYILDNLNYPENIENPKREIVRIEFKVSTVGETSDFIVLKSPENSSFEQEAIRVIKNGPKWSPAIKDGMPIEERVSLRLVFKP